MSDPTPALLGNGNPFASLPSGSSPFSTSGDSLQQILWNGLTQIGYLRPAATVIFIMLIWSGIRYIRAGSDTKKATEARNAVIASVVAALILISLNQIISLGYGFANVFHITAGGNAAFTNDNYQN